MSALICWMLESRYATAMAQGSSDSRQIGELESAYTDQCLVEYGEFPAFESAQGESTGPNAYFCDSYNRRGHNDSWWLAYSSVIRSGRLMLQLWPRTSEPKEHDCKEGEEKGE